MIYGWKIAWTHCMYFTAHWTQHNWFPSPSITDALSLSAFKLQNQPKIVIVPTKNDHSAISIAMNKGFRMVVATNDFIQYMYMFRFDHPSIWHGLVKYNQFIGAVISTSIKCINYFQC